MYDRLLSNTSLSARSVCCSGTRVTDAAQLMKTPQNQCWLEKQSSSSPLIRWWLSCRITRQLTHIIHGERWWAVISSCTSTSWGNKVGVSDKNGHYMKHTHTLRQCVRQPAKTHHVHYIIILICLGEEKHQDTSVSPPPTLLVHPFSASSALVCHLINGVGN